MPAALHAALDLAATRIEAFHRAQMPADLRMTDAAGLTLGMRWTPLDAVGLYVPGGKAAYPSSVLMNAIPARVAGVARIAMCVPDPGRRAQSAGPRGGAARGVTEIYRIGGAQAVAALAYGTATIAPVDRIVGPGNAYVAEAKRQVFGRVGIDSIAGPSEVVVIADAANDPRRIAIDLLAQAEHDEAAQSILITDDAAFADRRRRRRVAAELADAAPRRHRRRSWAAPWRRHRGARSRRGGGAGQPAGARTSANDDRRPAGAVRAIRHAGAAFLGASCPEALGDYVAGPNHVLPTGRTARFASGLSVFDFLKRTTWMSGGDDALARIGPAAIALAEAEGLHAHGRSIAVRLGNK